MRLGSAAVGAVLAAIGTALPESSVTFIAVVFGRTTAEKDLGVGAALGGPLVLSTLAYAIVGVALMLNRRGLDRKDYRVQIDHRRLGRDQGLFLLIFAVTFTLGLTAFPFKPLFGALLVVAYGFYAMSKMGNQQAETSEGNLEPLKILGGKPSTPGWAATQTLLALAVIGVASELFVRQLGSIGAFLHWPPQMTALLLSPIATELPETMNALIWVRQGKERLALANISGAMMIQATIPSALGLFFTRWQFDRSLEISGLATLAAMLFLWLVFRRGPADARALVPACVFYGIFAVLIGWYFVHRWEHVPAADHARANPIAGRADAVTSGAAAYREHCLSCHGAEARGDGRKTPTLRGAQLRKATDGDIEWFLRQGEAGEGMPAWATLPESQRWQIVSYLRSIQ
jgi:cation:H+ antiporter